MEGEVRPWGTGLALTAHTIHSFERALRRVWGAQPEATREDSLRVTERERERLAIPGKSYCCTNGLLQPLSSFPRTSVISPRPSCPNAADRVAAQRVGVLLVPGT